jgi:type VI secretion system protein ImpL
VVDNTALVESADTAQPAGRLETAGKAVTQGIDKILKPLKQVAGVSTAPAGAIVSAHFQPIHRLMAGAPGSAPIDPILAKMGQIEQQLKALGPEVGQGDALEALRNPAISELFKALQDEAAPLPPAIRNVVGQVGQKARDTVMSEGAGNLEKRYRQDVLQDCNKVVSGRYPFAASQNEVPLTDFGRLFGFDGVFDAFFKTNMEPFVDTSEDSWQWRPGSPSSSRSILDRFEAAARIRDHFFRPGSQTPALHFTVTLMDLDAAATRFILEIDGQRFDVGHNPPRKTPAAWPASSTGEALATFEDRSGAWPTLRYPGAWGWFRMIDEAQPQRESEMRVVLGFQNSGHKARVAVEAVSISNPFTTTVWKRFNCGS